MAFAQSSERRAAPGAPRLRLPATSTLASREIRSKCAPPPTCLMRVHSRRCCHRLRPDGNHPAKSRSAPVVSHHLDGLLRAPGPGLVASRCQKGFAAFPSCERCLPRLTPPRGRDPWPPDTRALSRDAFHTLRRSPPSSSTPHCCSSANITAALAPSPLALGRLGCTGQPSRRAPRPRGLSPPSGP
jgi:hypothetical protein